MATSTPAVSVDMVDVDSDLKCGTCLELFEDPRSLPCLHTFCLKCIKRTINASASFKCPVCRAEHELSEEKAELLPVDRYAVQELPLRRLLQEQQSGEAKRECQSCGDEALITAWCDECEAICQSCVAQHKKMAALRGHRVVEKEESECGTSSVKGSKTLSCPRHAGENLKYLCTECSELVCAECLLTAHKDHKYSTAEEARHNLEIKMEELVSLAVAKKEEFNEYLQKVKVVEDKAIESTEHMKSAVNKTFDVIVASVEARRNESLLSVSQEMKKIWSQKDMAEVRIAQVDSFIRFAEHTDRCATSTSYVAMATQAIKLIEQLKEARGDEEILDYKIVAIGAQCGEDPIHMRVSIPLDGVVELGQPKFKFTPSSGSHIYDPSSSVSITASLTVKELPIVLPTPHEGYSLKVKAKANGYPVSTSVNLIQSQGLSWEIITQLPTSYNFYQDSKLIIWCSVSENMGIKPGEVTYTLKPSSRPQQSQSARMTYEPLPISLPSPPPPYAGFVTTTSVSKLVPPSPPLVSGQVDQSKSSRKTRVTGQVMCKKSELPSPPSPPLVTGQVFPWITSRKTPVSKPPQKPPPPHGNNKAISSLWSLSSSSNDDDDDDDAFNTPPPLSPPSVRQPAPSKSQKKKHTEY